MKLILIFLTCANRQEADLITHVLLDKKLVVCVKKMPISSSFLWKGSKDHSEEVLLVMDSIEKNFEQIEEEVRKIHSYDVFVLVASPIIKSAKGVVEWARGELSDEDNTPNNA